MSPEGMRSREGDGGSGTLMDGSTTMPAAAGNRARSSRLGRFRKEMQTKLACMHVRRGRRDM